MMHLLSTELVVLFFHCAWVHSRRSQNLQTPCPRPTELISRSSFTHVPPPRKCSRYEPIAAADAYISPRCVHHKVSSSACCRCMSEVDVFLCLGWSRQPQPQPHTRQFLSLHCLLQHRPPTPRYILCFSLAYRPLCADSPSYFQEVPVPHFVMAMMAMMIWVTMTRSSAGAVGVC